ncbi:MAG TPA: LacI family DNA-binding transcriptional regulator [Armatimonadota bacterium]|jgi:LacI family transcriptional regulator
MNPPQQQPRKSVTLETVANEAGVHVATAATVLNGAKSNTRVSPETRRRVLDASERLGYRPNRLAQNLRRQCTRTIGLVAGTVENPFFAHMATLCEGYLLDAGYELVMAMDAGRYRDDRALIETVIDRGVDGLIVWNGRETEGRRLVERGLDLPVVIGGFPSEAVDSVAVDFEWGSRLAVEHLLEQGRSDIAFLCPSEAQLLCTAKMRQDGYEDVLERHRLEPRIFTYEGTLGDIGPARAAAEAIGRSDDCPDALFCFNDLVAIGAMMGLRRAGKSLPRDVALVGFDNIPMAAELDVPLSSVDMPIADVCRVAVEMLLQRLRGVEGDPREAVVHPVLYPRASSRRVEG